MKTKNRILVVVLVAGVLLFSQLTHVSLLRAESVYRNEEGHFSLTLPEGWEVAAQSDVDNLIEQIHQYSGKTINVDVVFVKMSSEMHPDITVNIKKDGRVPAEIVQEIMSDKKMLAKMKSYAVDATNKIPKDVLKRFEYGDMYYDEARRAIFMKIEGTTARNAPFQKATGTIATREKIGFGVTLLSNYGQVALDLNSTAEEYNSNFNDFIQIVDSVKFDKGYEYYPNGQLIDEGTFTSDNPEGSIKTYYENGKLKEESTYKDRKINGPSKTYYPSGQLKNEGTYKNGETEGLNKSYYENGQLLAEATYKNGKSEGLLKTFYENGQLKSEGTVKNGKPEGLQKAYYENGKLKMVGTYKDGKSEELKQYDENGNLKQ